MRLHQAMIVGRKLIFTTQFSPLKAAIPRMAVAPDQFFATLVWRFDDMEDGRDGFNGDYPARSLRLASGMLTRSLSLKASTFFLESQTALLELTAALGLSPAQWIDVLLSRRWTASPD